MSRLARALNSDDLTHREADCDIDVLQATGLVSIHQNLGVMIVEAKEGAAGDGPHSVARVKALEHALKPRIARIARRWGLRVRLDKTSAKVASELVLDRCQLCHGRGTIPMKYDGQRMVAVSEDNDGSSRDIDCHLCLGSGAARRDYHGRAKAAGFKDYTKKLAEFWEALLQSCSEAELAARQQLWRRMRKSSS